MSGQQLAAAQDYGQKIGSSAYSDWYNRLLGFANMGPQAAGMQGQAMTAGAQGIGSALGAMGQAQAQGTIGQSNAWANALNQGAGVAGWYSQQRAMQPQTPPNPLYNLQQQQAPQYFGQVVG
jgi:hypothetical protein